MRHPSACLDIQPAVAPRRLATRRPAARLGAIAAGLTLAAALSACAGQRPDMDADGAPPALQFAATLDAADGTMAGALEQVNDYERGLAQERQAISYALGSRGRASLAAPPAPVIASAAAGHVLSPMFLALDDYARYLGTWTGAMQAAPLYSNADALVKQESAAMDDLASFGRPVPPALRSEALAAIATLSTPPEQGISPDAFVKQREAAVGTVVRLSRAVIGTDEVSGLRGAVANARMRMVAERGAMLDALSRERSAGIMERYAAWHALTPDDNSLPVDEMLGSIPPMLARLQEAHAALAGNTSDADTRITAFAAAVQTLQQAIAGYKSTAYVPAPLVPPAGAAATGAPAAAAPATVAH